jgi:hypothetical protein
LELILALALSVIILGAIATSIYVCISTLAEQQKDIENKQIARNVITMVANDLRGAIQYKPADVSGLENLAASQLMAAGVGLGTTEGDGTAVDGGDTTGQQGGATEGGTGAVGGATTGGTTTGGTTAGGTTTNTTEPAMDPEDSVTSRPTMIGTSEVLMMDVSRLPRIDEYNPLVATRRDPQLPSDIKGITYFLGDSSGSSGRTTSNSRSDRMFSDEAEQLGGLYRRQIDRAVAAYAGEEDAISDVDDFADLIAPEVAEMTFRYFDGTDWQETWNSIEMEGFPLAVEVVLVLDPARAMAEKGTYTYGGFDPETMERVRRVIHLPIAEAPEEEE